MAPPKSKGKMVASSLKEVQPDPKKPQVEEEEPEENNEEQGEVEEDPNFEHTDDEKEEWKRDGIGHVVTKIHEDWEEMERAAERAAEGEKCNLNPYRESDTDYDDENEDE